MKIEFENQGKLQNPTFRYIVYAIIAMFLSLLHLVALGIISVAGITPDLLLILCVWIALREGQFVGIFAGFGCGLIFDILTYDVLGTNALAKTLIAFIAGFFYKETAIEQNLKSYRFLFIVALCSLLHNVIYFFFYLRISEISFLSFFAKNGIAASLYTTVFAIVVLLIRPPSSRLRA
jgi:rod shape-determining protein MreD